MQPTTLRRGLMMKLNTEAGLLQFQRLLQFEAKRRLRGQNDVLIPGECSATGAGAAAGKRADGRAFAASCQTADQRSQTGATARQDGSAFALAGFGSSYRGRGNRLFRPIHRDRS